MNRPSSLNIRLSRSFEQGAIQSRRLWRKASVIFLLWATTALVLQAQTFTVLYSFSGPDGSEPSAPLIQGIDGNFYGSTALGGPGLCRSGCGTIFKITPTGTLTTLHKFNVSDGDGPTGALAQTSSGVFYGTTGIGGSNGSSCVYKQPGCGTVYKMTASGALTSLYSFSGLDGSVPLGLIEGLNGDFYGATAGGGTGGEGGAGTFYQITPTGTLTTLVNFDLTDGNTPVQGLVMGPNGSFYGATESGGLDFGVLYNITPSGKVTTVFIFSSSSGGFFDPQSGPILGNNGELYGTTQEGGPDNGVAYNVTLDGTVNWAVAGAGSYMTGGLVQATDGNFYGTNDGGAGSIFQVTPSGTLTTLYGFCSLPNCADGAGPTLSLVQGTDGKLYGSTSTAGSGGGGTLFSFDMGLSPFVLPRPAIGKVGSSVQILGSDLTGASSVTFNGLAATFTVASPTLIKATVPTGATSGLVRVTTPGGTLKSNIVFRVMP
jgi:uncharacterized repeat protein (TIGR03803 family)